MKVTLYLQDGSIARPSGRARIETISPLGMVGVLPRIARPSGRARMRCFHTSAIASPVQESATQTPMLWTSCNARASGAR